MSAKEVKFGVDAAIACCAASKFSTNAVKVTLGPKGRNVVLDKSSAHPASPRRRHRRQGNRA